MEVRPVVSHILLTCCRLCRAARLTPGGSSPIATKGCIEDDVKRRERCVEVAASGEVSQRGWPECRLRRVVQDVGGNVSSWPEPYQDAVSRQHSSINTTTVLIEAFAKGERIGRGYGAAGIVFRATIARFCGNRSCHLAWRNAAAGSSVQSHLVGLCIVRAFDDVFLRISKASMCKTLAVY